MSMSEFERLLAALIPGRGRTAITLTEPPEDEPALLRLFDQALATGNNRQAPLANIHAPLNLYPNLGNMFWHVPIEDSSSEGVVRLMFDAPSREAA
jgi:hypothetical protein